MGEGVPFQVDNLQVNGGAAGLGLSLARSVLLHVVAVPLLPGLLAVAAQCAMKGAFGELFPVVVSAAATLAVCGVANPNPQPDAVGFQPGHKPENLQTRAGIS